MKITFLRHGSLLPPFNDYSLLNLSQLTQLARQEIDPTIDTAKISNSLKDAEYIASQYDKLIVSTSKRTYDTAIELGKKINLPDPIKLSEVNEIMFDPSKLTTELGFQSDGLKIIRKKLFVALANGLNLESGKQVIERIHILDQILNKLNVGSVLVVTHGFFMRYLDIFYRQKSNDFSVKALNEAINYDYASGFTVNID